MVLENLSSSLKDTLKKVARAIFVDSKLIDELIKDLQRSLLQADVNVKLVFDLSKRIKERALDEKTPSSISKKEHLINIVYEELVKFLGESKTEIKINKKPTKIMLIGLLGNGKCVHKDSKIVLSTGEISSAENVYNRFKCKEIKIDDGYVIDVNSDNILVPSFNPKTLKIENKKITNLWKLNGKELLKVYLDNGNDFNVKVTPEHPFFVLRNNRIEQIRADQLNEDDFVAIPFRCEIKGSTQNLFNDLKKLNLDVKNYKKDCSKINIKKDILPNLLFSRNYCCLTTNLKNGVTPIQLIDKYKHDLIETKHKNSQNFIKFPIKVTEELAEFLGYVLGDGHLHKNGVKISNQDKEIIERICYLSEKLFCLKVQLIKDKRRSNLFSINLNSQTLVEVLNKIFGIPIGEKGKNLIVPQQINLSSNEVVKSFLKAYFDCDSHPRPGQRNIELSSESHPLIIDISNLLNRFGIISSISKKYTGGIPYWRLFIRSRDAERYSKQIGYLISYKKQIAENFEIIGKIQNEGKRHTIPLGSSLKELRDSLGFSIGEIQSYTNISYGYLERIGEISKESLSKLVALYTLKHIGNKAKILNFIKNEEINSLENYFVNGFINSLKLDGYIENNSGQILITEKANQYLNNLGQKTHYLEFFKLLINSDVCWARIKKIEQTNKEEFVYDLTVEDNHSFIADNIIVHNTSTSAKIAKYFKNRGKKVCLIQLDVYRPSSLEQLQVLGESISVDVFGDEKEKNALKIYKKFEKNFDKYDLVIVDTAGRHALDKELINEIEELNNYIKPDERILVIGADIGQGSKEQAEQFHKSCNITGIIVTKMDGTAKGGGALTGAAVSNAPIKFLSVGEKIDDLEEFNPKGFVGRLLGMGDIESLLEKAKLAIDEDQSKKLTKNFLEGRFSLIDLYEQMNSMRKMGPLSKILDMIPGVGNLGIPKEFLDNQEGKLDKWKILMNSMTKEELENPDIIDSSRVERIAKGSGCNTNEIRELLKQYKQSQKVIKLMKGTSDPTKLMKKFKGKLPKGLKF